MKTATTTLFKKYPQFQRMMILAGVLSTLILGQDHARAVTVEDVLKKINATGQATDTAEVQLDGIISTRTTLKDGQVMAFLHLPGSPGLPLLASKETGSLLIPRNKVTLAGKLTAGPFGSAVLKLNDASVKLQGTNQPFGASEIRGPEFFKDASALSGRYVQVTNVTFVGDKFDDSGLAKIKGDTGEVTLLVTKSLAGQNVPKNLVNVYGIPVKVGSEWRLAASRFLPSNGKAMQALATKHTCFTCHNPDMKLVGPAYRDVAAKYGHDAEAAAKLILQMENGGSGKWGPVPMLPFKGRVPPDDMKQLAEWILGYRWDALLAE